jgi:hypothetical protein
MPPLIYLVDDDEDDRFCKVDLLTAFSDSKLVCLRDEENFFNISRKNFEYSDLLHYPSGLDLVLNVAGTSVPSNNMSLESAFPVAILTIKRAN